MRWRVNEDKAAVKVDLPDTYGERKVVIPEDVYAKITHWTDRAKGEVSGMGEVEVKDGDYIITDVHLLKQESSGAHTDLDAEALVDLRVELDKAGRAQDGFKLWWHSHADMTTYWSTTDTNTQKMLVSDTDWMLSIVVNKKRHVRACLDFREGAITIKVDEVPVFVETSAKINSEELDKEFDDKVKEPKAEWAYGTGYTHPGAQDFDWKNRPKYTAGYNYDYGQLQWWDKGKQMWEDGEPQRKPGRRPINEEHPNYIHVHGPVGSRTHDHTDGFLPPIASTDVSTPASRGDLHWEGMDRKEKKLVRKFTTEEEPMCLPKECGNCDVKGYVFWVRRLSEFVCMDCIQVECDIARPRGIPFRDIFPLKLFNKRTYRRTQITGPTEQVEQGDK